MAKPRAFDPRQHGFTFEPPVRARRVAELAGLDRLVASIVGEALKGDTRSRDEVAGAMSALLGEEVSRWTLDGYASEARDNHNISAARLCALIAATERFDLLDAIVRRIGASLLVGDEIHTARVGHLHAQRAAIDAQLRAVKSQLQPIKRGTHA